MPGPQLCRCNPFHGRFVGRGLAPSAAARGWPPYNFRQTSAACGASGNRPYNPAQTIQYYIKGQPNENCHYLPRLPEEPGRRRRILSRLIKDGHTTVADPAEADIIIINTCGFIESAKTEAIENILMACQYKQENPDLKVIVTRMPG